MSGDVAETGYAAIPIGLVTAIHDAICTIRVPHGQCDALDADHTAYDAAAAVLTSDWLAAYVAAERAKAWDEGAENGLLDRLARALAKADGKVWWTDAFPAAYRDQAAALLADGWRVIPPGSTALPDDQRKPGEAFCSDCPDHEGCSQGVPCDVAKRAAR